MQNATALFMNVVEGEFCEVRIPDRAGAHSLPRIFMHHHNM